MGNQFFNVKRKILESWYSVEGLTNAQLRIQRRQEKVSLSPKHYIKSYMVFSLSASNQPISYDGGGGEGPAG